MTGWRARAPGLLQLRFYRIYKIYMINMMISIMVQISKSDFLCKASWTLQSNQGRMWPAAMSRLAGHPFRVDNNSVQGLCRYRVALAPVFC